MIRFSIQDIPMPDIDTALLTRWIGEVCALHGRRPGSLTYLFCSEPYMLRANIEFLGHDYYTDIITFPISEGETVSADMLICPDTVATNASLQGEPYQRELHRVIIHGVLHLCGIDDKGPGQRGIMEQNENQALRLLDKLTNA